MKKLSIILLSIILFNCKIYAQDLRKEIETKYASDQYHLAPIGKEGAIMFTEMDEKAEKGKKKWVFIKYDTDFSENWEKEFGVSKGMEYKQFHVYGKSLYLLLTAGDEYQILNVNVENGDIKFSYGKSEYPLSVINDFKVIDQTAFIGGDKSPSGGEICLKNFVPCIAFLPLFIPSLRAYPDAYMLVNKMDSKINVEVPLPLKQKSSVSNIEVDEERQSAYAVISNRVGDQSALYLKEVDLNGKFKSTIIINPGNKDELLDGKLTSMNENEKILVGTWGRDGSYGAQGVFFSKIENNKQKYLRQYNFADFKNFFKYLSKNWENKVKKKVQKKKAVGKDMKLSYRLLVHDIIQRGNEYIMIAEAYYAEYRTEQYMTTTSSGQTVMRTRYVFDGWRYTHAIVAGFSEDGELLWDNCFEIWNVKSFTLKERVKMIPDETDIVLAYSFNGEINYKIVSENSVVEDKKHQPIKTDFASDKIKQDYDPEMEYWYGNYFIAFGVQKIKNTEDKKKRTVFYLNKVGF